MREKLSGVTTLKLTRLQKPSTVQFVPSSNKFPEREKLSRNVTTWGTTRLVRLTLVRNFFGGLFALFKGEGALCSDNVLAHCSSGFFRLTRPDRTINLLMQLQ